MARWIVDFKEIAIRFIMGGLAVVACYIISVYSPVKFIGGVFAAFPAVMAAAVIMAGMQDGSSEAGEVAKGAVSGMVGCSACVLSALFLIRYFNSWIVGLSGSVAIWFIVAMLGNIVVSRRRTMGQEH